VLTQLVPMPGAVRTALIAVAILLILPVVLRTLGGVDVALGAEQSQAALWSGSLLAPGGAALVTHTRCYCPRSTDRPCRALAGRLRMPKSA
jgi:hypothetical protein